MMAEKARLFDDQEIFNEFIVCDHPMEAKQLGRKENIQIRFFDNKSQKNGTCNFNSPGGGGRLRV